MNIKEPQAKLIIDLVKSHSPILPIQWEILQGQATLLKGGLKVNQQGKGQTNLTLKPDAYTVLLTDSGEPPWKLERKVTVESNQTAPFRLSLSFVSAHLEVESEPPGAEVTWPPEVNAPTQVGTKAKTPFTNRRFKAGEIPFTAHHRYYSNTTAVHSFYPAAETDRSQFPIRLKRTQAPMTKESWTNFLGTTFLPVGPHLWASRTETTVGEFDQFVRETGHDATRGMFSVTSNGWKQIGNSWKEPGRGFVQATNYPVIGVNWADAAKFCEWLDQREHANGRLAADQTCRLPTTNEWFELAGNARFPWGANAEVVGNYSGREVTNSDWPKPWPILSDQRDDFPRTAPVDADMFGTNCLGFRHLGGNAAEWCDEKVLGGGSWFDGESGNLKALQTKNIEVPKDPAERHDRNGFRVVIWEPERETIRK